MPNEFQYHVFLSHSAKDKQAVPGPNVVRPLAERLREAGPEDQTLIFQSGISN